MPPQESVMPTTCNHCGEPFNTSRQSPSRYCSIACEEGRAPRAMSDPRSDGYHLHLQGNPEALVGKVLVARGLSLVDYSPDWCKGPNDWAHGVVVSVDEERETYVRKDDIVLGTVYDYSDGEYHIEHEDIEAGEVTDRSIDGSLTVSMIRKDYWWAEG